MTILVYKITGRHTRSIATATLVDQVETNKMPSDQIAFAEEHGGDFIEVAAAETARA